MAVSPFNLASGPRSKTAAKLLFERLPDRLFSPLASPNRRQYWELLCLLHARRFGPDAPMPPSHGFPIREITADIQEALTLQEAWESEDGETQETPIPIRANGIFNRLLEAGWFRTELYGVERRLSMRPAVAQFLTKLVSFAETGPVFVAGKIRSIDVNLQLVKSGQAGGDTLSEAAEQTRHLLEHVRNTSMNIRDLMESLHREATTAQYVQRFFNDYIESMFIGDYRELRTREHPLSKRSEILQRVEEISAAGSLSARLIDWYEAKRCTGDRARAEMLFTRDIERLLELERIDDYLDRLDDEIRRANKRALVFLDYRLRSLQPVDQLIRFAIQAVAQVPQASMAVPFSSGELMCPVRLAEPRVAIERPAPLPLRQHVPSPIEIARARVMIRARDARTMTPPKLAEFVARQLGGRAHMESGDLNLTSVQDLRGYQTLASSAMVMNSTSRLLQSQGRMWARGLSLKITDRTEDSGVPISGVPFTISLRKSIPSSGGGEP